MPDRAIPGKTLYDIINPQEPGACINPARWEDLDEDSHAHYARCEEKLLRWAEELKCQASPGETGEAVSAQAPLQTGSEWKPIESAPKDGTLIDVSCVSMHPDDDKGIRVRLTNIAWHTANEIFPHTGWIRVTDDGNYDLVESPPTSPLGLPAWKPTHWMPLPPPPQSQLEEAERSVADGEDQHGKQEPDTEGANDA